ncbi:MAG: Fic family protein [Capsulimonas sp.]|uniref:Fic family protein n=1 Tax=Capsulimonas sp. TaxID=2494211 RepID=UPI0032664F8C
MLNTLPLLPNIGDIETKSVLRKLAKAHQALAELKGVVASIPNKSILISTLSLQEAKDSSAIENIVTTHDELYRSDSQAQSFVSIQAKEVHHYATALRNGFDQIRRTGLMTNNDILEMHACIEDNQARFRKLPGTALKNQQTGEIVYTPPQHPDEIAFLMANLEQFINDDGMSDWDPLIKMAVIHHRFESIHPFYDGNGRMGRIINILYLVMQGLLGSPILYLSRYINQHKSDYYRLLQSVRKDGEWEPWLLYMLEGVEETSRQTIAMVQGIQTLMLAYKHKMRDELPKIYSQDLINNLFRHPYTKIDFVMDDLQVTRQTAAKYLDELVRIDLLSKRKYEKENYYFNDALFELLRGASAP